MPTHDRPTTRPLQPLVALRAVVRLIREPTDTQQVFTVIEALSGRTPLRLVARMRRSPSGAALLASRPDILGPLADRAALARLPDDSVGRAYLRFLEGEAIAADGLVAAAAAGESDAWHARDDDVGFVSRRLRDTHDLWHVLTGYAGDVLGEAALLAFSAAQTGNLGVATMALAAGLRAYDREVTATLARAFADGRRAAWLPAVAFEELLASPLDAVRRELGIAPARPYVRMRPDWTREAA